MRFTFNIAVCLFLFTDVLAPAHSAAVEVSDIDAPSKTSPENLIYWKLRKVGGTTFCVIVRRYAQHAGKKALIKATDSPHGQVQACPDLVCMHRFDDSLLEQLNRPSIPQIITMREPLSAMVSHYYFYAGSLFRCLQTTEPKQWRCDSCREHFGVDDVTMKKHPKGMYPYQLDNGFDISQYLLPGAKFRTGFSMPTMAEAVQLAEYYAETHLHEWTPFLFWTDDAIALRFEFLRWLDEAKAGQRQFTVTLFQNISESLSLIQRKLHLTEHAMLGPSILRQNSFDQHPSIEDWDPEIVAYLSEQMEVRGVNAVYRAAKEHFEWDIKKTFPEGDVAFRAEVERLSEARAYHAEHGIGDDHLHAQEVSRNSQLKLESFNELLKQKIVQQKQT